MPRIVQNVRKALGLMLKGAWYYLRPVIKPVRRSSSMTVGRLLLWLLSSLGIGWMAYLLFRSTVAFWFFAVVWLVVIIGLDLGRRGRPRNGFLCLLLILGLTTAVALTVNRTARAGIVPHFCYTHQSDWFGGYTTSPKFCEPASYPPGKGCSSLDVWHTGRLDIVDYKFHLYVSWCRHRLKNGRYTWDKLKITTGVTNLGATAEYKGITGHQVNYTACQVGEQLDSPYQAKGCVKIIYHAEVVHHIPGIPADGWPVGHPTVSVYINVDGNPAQGGYVPFWNDSQF